MDDRDPGWLLCAHCIALAFGVTREPITDELMVSFTEVSGNRRNFERCWPERIMWILGNCGEIVFETRDHRKVGMTAITNVNGTALCDRHCADEIARMAA